MMRSLVLLSFLGLALAACGTDASDDGVAALQPPINPSAPYRVVVSFGSPGSGIDEDAYSDVLAYIGAYDTDLSPDLYEWGHEGERNLCFTLNVDATVQQQIVAEFQQIAQSGAYVGVYEQAPCDLSLGGED